MTFLPIVERELRVAARKRGTFWLRVVAALVALVIGSGFFLIASAFPGGQMPLGGALFSILTWLSLAAALSAGLFFTSDCLSEEKREGTLGFLFLTDLRGYDVVLGKLAATSLRCGFALLAVFPVLAITQLMGGVEVGQFWRTLLALTHALFFSLAAGMLVSTVSRDAQKALSGTLLLLIFFLAGGPAVDGALALAQQHSFHPLFSFTSPGYVFVKASGWGGGFWPALLTSQALAWLMLGLSSILLPRTWQQKSAKSSRTMTHRDYWWRYGGVKRRSALRRKLLAVNPVLWLAARERLQGSAVWLLAVVLIEVFVVMLVFDAAKYFWAAWSFIGGAVAVLLYLWTASQASQFFAEARRTGLIELLLAAPLSTHDIVHGPWLALVRLFAWPVAICLVVSFVPQVFNTITGMGRVTGVVGSGLPMVWLSGGGVLVGTLVTLANLAALGWFGLWMGLVSKNARIATLKTIVLVQVVPWFVITVASSLIPLMLPSLFRTGSTNSTFFVWYSLLELVLTAGLSLAKDAFFISLARRKLLRDFRTLAMPAMAKLHSPFLPPIIAAKS